MSSDLQRLADAVRSLANPSGTVRAHVAQASVGATRLSASVPGGVPSAAAASTSFQAAGKSLASASQLLDSFARDADRFAASLVGAGGSAPVASFAGAGAGGTLAQLPDGFTWVALSDIEDVADLDFKQDTSPEDLAWGMQALSDVILPGLARGMTIDDFRQMDADLGQMGSRSYADTYTGFFSLDEGIVFSPGDGGKLAPENGRHRVLVARRFGFSFLPGRIVKG